MAGQGQELEIGIRATLKNALDIQKQLQEALENGLVVFSDKDNQAISQRIKSIQALLDQGLFKPARKGAEELNGLLLRIFNNIHQETGGASNDLAELFTKMNAAQKALAQHEKRATDLVFRGNAPKRGALSDADQAFVQTTLGLKNNWNAATGVKVGSEKLQDTTLTPEQRAQITLALNKLGYEIVEGNLKLIDGLRETYDKQYQETHKQLAKDAASATTQYNEELNLAETGKISADGHSFDDATILDLITKAVKALTDATEKYNEALRQEREEEKKVDDEEERVVEATTQHTKAVTQNSNAVTKAVSTFFGYQMVIRQLRRLWREAIHTITELDKQLTNQAIVTGMTRQETWQLIGTYQDLADATGLAQTTIAGVTTEYLRQGESLQNALVLTKAAAAAATVAGISAQDSVKYLTTAIHGFKLEAEDALAVSDKFAALAVEAATNYEDLAIALSKVASQAALAGMSMDYTLALLTTGLDVTQEAPESIGTALKTVIARMREISDYGKTLEDGIDINQVEDGLHAVNIELRNGEGELRSTEAVLDELGKKWETLTANQQAAVAKALAGTRQQSRLVAIMENYNKVLEYQQTAAMSIGATTAQQVTYLTGLEAATNRLQNAYQSLIEQLVHSDEIIGVVNFITKLIKQVTKFLSQPLGRWALFSTIGALLLRSEQFVEKMRQGFNGMLASLNKIASKQKEITQEEQKQVNLTQQQNSKRTGITQVLNALLSPGKGWWSGVKNTAAAAKNDSFFGIRWKSRGYAIDSQTNALLLTKREKQRLAYINQELKSEKAQSNENYKQYLEERKQTLEDKAQANANRGGVNKQDGAQLGSKIMTGVAIATTVASWATELMDIFKNATKEAAQEQLEKATEIQSKIYNNTKTISTVDKLSKSFDKLNDKVIKTTEDMQEMNDLRTQLLEVLGLDETQAKGITTATLRDRALAKRAEAETKNLELVGDLVKNLMGEAGYNADWGSILTNIGMKAGAGAGLGAMTGQWQVALAGAAIGGVVGIVEEVTRAVKSSDSRGKITEMLKTDEGTQAFQNALNYSYQAVSGINEDTEAAVRSGYSNLVSLLSGSQIEELLKQYDYDFAKLTTTMRDTFIDVADSMKVLNNESATVSEKTDAVVEVYQKLRQESPYLADAFEKAYAPYLKLSYYLGDSVPLLEEFGWSIANTGELINQLAEQGLNAQQEINALAEALRNGSADGKELAAVTKNWSATAVEAAADLITSGRSMQDIADEQTAAVNKVKGMRDTQAKWGSMSASERRAYLNDNAEFFRIPGAREAFLSGADITPYLATYRQDLQSKLRGNLEDQRAAAQLRLAELRKKQSEMSVEDAKELNAAIQDLENNIADLDDEIMNVDHMFDLSWKEIVDKEQEQLSKMKAMYQKQEDMLVDSLNKRKEAYQNYFDTISRNEEVDDYNKNRNQLIDSITRLSAGTDAVSRHRVNELRKQLAQIEQEEEKRRTEQARQDVIENIDSQIQNIQDYFEDLLDNNAKLLSKLDESTHLQYLTYLDTLNLTDAEKQLAIEEATNLFRGRWGQQGQAGFDAIQMNETPVPQSPTTEKDPSSTLNIAIGSQSEKVTLRQTEMKDLINEMFTWLNNHAGTHFIVS